MLDEAAGLGVDLPLTRRALECYDAAARDGLGKSDATMLPAHWLAGLAGAAIGMATPAIRGLGLHEGYGVSRPGRRHRPGHHGVGDVGQSGRRRIHHAWVRHFGPAPARTRLGRAAARRAASSDWPGAHPSSSPRSPHRPRCSRSRPNSQGQRMPGRSSSKRARCRSRRRSRRAGCWRSRRSRCSIARSAVPERKPGPRIWRSTASGPRRAYRRCIPVFEGFARANFFLGPFGAGSKMKFLANLLVAIHNVSAAEALVLGMKAGLDPATMVKCWAMAPARRACCRYAAR